MNFMFSWQKQYLTRSLCSLVRYCSRHSNIKFISSRYRVISSVYLLAIKTYYYYYYYYYFIIIIIINGWEKNSGEEKSRTQCIAGLFFAFMTFFCSNFFLTCLSLFPAPTNCPWVSEDVWYPEIIKEKLRVISRTLGLRLITLTETLITLDITKTESDNCFIIHWTKKMEVIFLCLYWQEATQSAQTWHDYPWPWVSLTKQLYNLELWCHRHWFRKFTVCFWPIRKEFETFNE